MARECKHLDGGPGRALSTTLDPMAGAGSAASSAAGPNAAYLAAAAEAAGQSAPGQDGPDEVGSRLECAVEELRAAHRECLEVDAEFAHEVCQFLFAVECLKGSWKARRKSQI